MFASFSLTCEGRLITVAALCTENLKLPGFVISAANCINSYVLSAANVIKAAALRNESVANFNKSCRVL